jgi:lipoprotein-anchoring transpeptidase ErfK/SrfK
MGIGRRDFLAAGAAAVTTAAMGAPARAYTVPPEHMPRIVRMRKNYAAQQIIVDPNTFHLYWTLGENQAIRYVVGVGRDGLYESGTFSVGRKAKWPSWTPTPAMIRREPDKYEQYADGVPGGPTNPLGARALYLYNARGFDTALRIHGTPQPWTVMRAVSNGCARLVNSHIVHLYDQVPVGAPVLLLPKS